MMDGEGLKAKYRLLVVDDDARLCGLLQRYLGENGFEVKTVNDGAGLDQLLKTFSFHLIILDLMLPSEDGLSILRRLRAAKENVPVILLTAKGDEVDRIVGLEMGADDYLAKPFNPRELLARIHAVLRRKGDSPAGAPGKEGEAFLFGPFRLDLSTRTLSKNNRDIPLTTGEFALLRVFVSNPRRPMTRDRLMELTRGRDLDPMDRAIDVQISRLRKIIETGVPALRFIQTVWGHGYSFIPEGVTEEKKICEDGLGMVER